MTRPTNSWPALCAKVLLAGGLGSAAAVTAVVAVLSRVEGSVGIEPPSRAQLVEEDQERCALFRHLPGLKDKASVQAAGRQDPSVA